MNSPFLLNAGFNSIYGYSTLCVFIDLLVDIWVVSSFWLLRIKLLWTFTYKYLCRYIFSFILSKRVGLLGHRVHLINRRRNCLFSEVVAPFYIPINHVWGCLLHILSNFSHSSGVWWYFIVAHNLYFPNDQWG